MRKEKYVNKFVEEWIETKEKETEETPKDFSKLEADLPQLMDTLKAEDIELDIELVKIDARRLFNANVGIDQLIDLDHDNQLQEAIDLIKMGGVEKALASTTADL
jgi:hypothetical protein